jgi:hypothetical protein
MTTPDPTNPPAATTGRRRRAVRLTLIILAVAVLTALAASFQLSSR